LLAVVAASAAAALGLAAVPAGAAPKDSRFVQVNVVSDQPGVAPILDPLLVNPKLRALIGLLSLCSRGGSPFLGEVCSH
jgi:hypothetical protein